MPINELVQTRKLSHAHALALAETFVDQARTIKWPEDAALQAALHAGLEHGIVSKTGGKYGNPATYVVSLFWHKQLADYRRKHENTAGLTK